MSNAVRGSNPIWLFDDLVGNLLDDNYWLFTLQNQIPYQFATVWQDPDMNVPWSNPIQFLANGTLPNNIYFDPTQVYRLEVRASNTQAGALIYEVNNYVPGSDGGIIPPSNLSIATDNQITNPQFSLISFSSPLTLTNVTNPAPIEVAPGWFLNLTGTGNVTITRDAFNDTTPSETNAPYGLEINLTGSWTGTPYLSQTFAQNGSAWSGQYISISVTASVTRDSPQTISAQLVDSNSTILAVVLAPTSINSTLTQYTGVGQIPASTNPNTPPAASVQFQLLFPPTVDIILTSIQLVANDSDIEFPYQQETIERQQDYTFHYYRDSLLRRNKDSLLTGWDFGLNPWQFTTTTQTNVAANQYTADQTIVVQQAYVASATPNNVSAGRASLAQEYGFNVTSVTATNQFAIVQYIDPTTIRPMWGQILSSLVRLSALKQNTGANLRIKMRLIYRASLPSTIGQAEPIASWTALGEPVYADGWTPIAPENDPVYNLANGDNELFFENMLLPTNTNANMTLGIVLYTLDPMLQTGTPDNIVFNKVSLVQNRFAIDSNTLTFDETLRRCQYYYETSYPPGSAPFGAYTSGIIAQQFATYVGTTLSGFAYGFWVPFKTIKRAQPVAIIYDTAGNINQLTSALYGGGTLQSASNITINSWSVNGAINGLNGIGNTITAVAIVTTVTGTLPQALILINYTANARLGT